jgi:hypothetical protein
MSESLAPDIITLVSTYSAFNARDIGAALAKMTSDVTWPKAFKGGYAHGHEEVRAYWTEQWSEINPKVQPTKFEATDSGVIRVTVHQVVRDLSGRVVADSEVVHRFTMEDGLIKSMEVG